MPHIALAYCCQKNSDFVPVLGCPNRPFVGSVVVVVVVFIVFVAVVPLEVVCYGYHWNLELLTHVSCGLRRSNQDSHVGLNQRGQIRRGISNTFDINISNMAPETPILAKIRDFGQSLAASKTCEYEA